MARSFRSLYRHGFVRVAAATLETHLADPAANADSVLGMAAEAHGRAVSVVVFPELCISGYAISDLLQQDALLGAVEAAIETIVARSAELLPLILVGAPLRHRGRLYNAAAAVHRGRLLGVVPKIHLPNYREFYERRHFASGAGVWGEEIAVGALKVPFGADLLFVAEDLGDLVVHAEICEDLWVPIPPSAGAALAGATVLANLSASNITIAKAETRRMLCQSQSARCLAAYLYAAAGIGESTTDLAWDGQTGIFENGVLLAESERFPAARQMAVADIDLELLVQERMRMGSFEDNAHTHARPGEPWRRVSFRLAPPEGDFGLERVVARFPFVPASGPRLAQDCYEAYNIQVQGLKQRLAASGTRRAVIGISGGLDSTQALIVAAKCFDLLGRPRSDIAAVTLPGFGTSDATKANAVALMRAFGVTAREIDIRPAAERMLADIGHPFARGEPVYDVTFENVQAGLRTDYLFRIANREEGLVVGTGDLSELALGWCTYGVGDQMAHYNVNSGVPKTLIQHLIRWVVSSRQFEPAVLKTLGAVLETVISPELVPPGAKAELQSTEAIVGPYALQDFSLYHVLRYGFRPSKIAFLAWHAWADASAGEWPEGIAESARRAYGLPEIRAWLRVFLQRFFGFSQFKRSAMPNGPKVSAGGALSPRGDWRAPSDGNARVWLEELEREVPEG
ncbi:MAG TPA: NAD(+) synthase [Acetobacteraceae bacterium]|nr:NAD(+) synthase [Acetobacteraceae bacterium]